MLYSLSFVCLSCVTQFKVRHIISFANAFFQYFGMHYLKCVKIIVWDNGPHICSVIDFVELSFHNS